LEREITRFRASFAPVKCRESSPPILKYAAKPRDQMVLVRQAPVDHASRCRNTRASLVLRKMIFCRTEGMDLNKGARKLRHAAEREATGKNRDAARRESDTKAAEAHPELTKPEHRKAKPGSRKQE
jgi:hypothetical protein